MPYWFFGPPERLTVPGERNKSDQCNKLPCPPPHPFALLPGINDVKFAAGIVKLNLYQKAAYPFFIGDIIDSETLKIVKREGKEYDIISAFVQSKICW